MADNLTMDQAVDELGDLTELLTGEAEEEDAEEHDDPTPDDDEEVKAEEEEDEPDEESEEEEEEPDTEELSDATVLEWETKAGEKHKATFAELKSGYIREQDYTRKNMEVADMRREVEAERDAITTKHEKLDEALTQWAIEAEPQIDWVRLSQENPQEYIRASAWYASQKEKKDAARDALAAMKQEIHADKVQRAEKYLLREFPEWRDHSVAMEATTGLMAAARTYGITDDQFRTYLVENPALALVLKDAAAFREMKEKPAKVEKRVSKPGKTLRPGPKTTAKQKLSRKTQEAARRFGKAPTMQNALAALDGVDLGL
jgi:hypothetical protein